jgi:GNAT superfamily N-acetyltransferase
MTQANLRKARQDDLPAILYIIKDAKAFLKEQGIDQWQNGYPNMDSIKQDILDDVAYVLEDNDKVVAYAAVLTGEDPAYTKITDGNWLNDSLDYVTVHRVAVSGNARGKGYGKRLFREIFETFKHYDDFRCDTHPQNKGMNGLLKALGFTYQGIVMFESERFAYQRLSHQTGQSRDLEDKSLFSQLKRLKRDLTEIIFQRDKLVYWTCPQIERDFQVQLGGMELELNRLRITYFELRHEIELRQEAISQKIPLDEIAAQEIIREAMAIPYSEFEAQEQRHEEVMATINDFDKVAAPELMMLDMAFYRIIELTHPDLYIDMTEEGVDLYQMAVEAYRNAQLAELKSLESQSEQLDYTEPSTYTHARLKAEVARLQEIADVYESEIQAIQNNYPYTVQEFVASDAMVDELRQEYLMEMADLKGYIATYREKLKDL